MLLKASLYLSAFAVILNSGGVVYGQGIETGKSRQQEPVERVLSQRQTLGAAFLTPDDPLWRILSRANPGAREALHRILADRSLSLYHVNAILMIGFVGDSDDLPLLEAYLKESAARDLDIHEAEAVRGVCDAVAVLVRRKVEGAEVLLEKMLARKYWEELEFADFPHMDARSGGPSWELVSAAVYASAYVSPEFALESRKKCLANEPDAAVRAFHERRYLGNSLKGVNATFEQALKTPLEPLDVRYLGIRSNGDFERPAPNPNYRRDSEKLLAEYRKDPRAVKPAPLSDDEQRKALIEAQVDFENAMTALARGNAKDVAPRVYDLSGIPRGPAEEEVERAVAALRSLEPLAKELIARDIDPRNVVAERVVREEKGESAEIVEVRFELPETEKLVRSVLDESTGEPTVNRETGCLVVVMRKHDGKWYWHPFGW